MEELLEIETIKSVVLVLTPAGKMVRTEIVINGYIIKPGAITQAQLLELTEVPVKISWGRLGKDADLQNNPLTTEEAEQLEEEYQKIKHKEGIEVAESIQVHFEGPVSTINTVTYQLPRTEENAKQLYENYKAYPQGHKDMREAHNGDIIRWEGGVKRQQKVSLTFQDGNSVQGELVSCSILWGNIMYGTDPNMSYYEVVLKHE